MGDEITVDDIQIGATADIQWKKGNVSEIYPAVLQKSRNQRGVVQYRVHYKNWNKRYDEWVLLEDIMRVYAEDGTLLKSRVPVVEAANDSGDESDEPLKPTRPKRKSARQLAKPRAESEHDSDDSDSVPLKRPVRSTAAKKPVNMIDQLDSDDNSDKEEEQTNIHAYSFSEAKEEEPKVTNTPCAANCGKNAQPASIYCSVECIMGEARKAAKNSAKSKDDAKTPEEESPPPLEDVDDHDVHDEHIPDDADSDEDFMPTTSTEKSPKKKRAAKIKVKRKEEKQKTPVKPKPVKRLSSGDIETIMKDVEKLKDTDPIMVMKNGALLMGYAAPRKSSLRQFLEENVNQEVQIIFAKNKQPESSMERSRDRINVLSRDHNAARQRDKVKREKQISARPVAKVAPSFKGDASSNPYARAEKQKEVKKEKKEDSKKDKKRRLSDKVEKVPEKPKRKGEVDADTLALMQSVKNAQRRRKEEEKKAKSEKNPEVLKKRLSIDGEQRKRTSSQTNAETPPKKARRDSDGAIVAHTSNRTPEPAPNERSRIRRSLRETLTHRSQNSGKDNAEDKLDMDTNSIAKLVGKIEKSMFEKYGEVNKDYKNKFRTIQFNLKDTKNDYFWRRVILGEISASTLHKMSPTEMGSKEKMEWRKQQQQNELEQIKKIEEIKQKEALKPTAKITHKGEIEIERFDETFDRTNEFNNSAREETENEAKEEIVKMETASEKSAIPKKETAISAAEKETINRMISKSAKVKPDSVDVLPDPTPVDAGIGGGESPKTPDYVYNPESPDEGPLSDMEALPESPPMLSPGAPSVDQSEEASSAETKSENSSTMSKVWSGKLVFTEASTFRANAYVISGNLSSSALKAAVPKQMAVAGKIDYKTVGEYINGIRGVAHGETRISILSLYGVSQAEETGYVNSLTYLSERNKVGVVKIEKDASLKDVYLVALQENETPPSWMNPMDGAGLEDDHPAIILAIAVKKSEKKKTDKEKKSRNLEQIVDKTKRDVPMAEIPKISDDVFNSLKEAVKDVAPNPNTLPRDNFVPPPTQVLPPVPPQGGGWGVEDDRHRDAYYDNRGYDRDNRGHGQDNRGHQKWGPPRDSQRGHGHYNGPRGGGRGGGFRGGRRHSGDQGGWNNHSNNYDRHSNWNNQRGSFKGRRRDY